MRAVLALLVESVVRPAPAAASALPQLRAETSFPAHTSLTDNDGYDAVVKAALTDEKVFATFKQAFGYRQALEHITPELGRSYLDVVKGMSPDMVSQHFFAQLAKQNAVGGTNTTDYGSPVGPLSPTMLRYWKAASDIAWLVGSLDGKRVLEIGVGYGGLAQALFVRFQQLREYTLVDLPIVEQLAQKDLNVVLDPADLERLTLYNTNSENTTLAAGSLDLCISNYAFGELHGSMADTYVRNILPACKAGYMTWNSFVIDVNTYKPKIEAATGEALTLNEEIPFSGYAANKIVTWGLSARRTECWAALQKDPTAAEDRCRAGAAFEGDPAPH